MKTFMKKVVFVLGICLLAAGFVSSWAAEQQYPERPVEFIINFPPGGPVDTGMRIIQQPLQAALNVPVVLTTKGGAGGALGADFVSKAKPDGYTVLATNSGAMVIAPNMNPQIAYRIQDFTPICAYAFEPTAVTGKKDAPWKNFEGMVDYAKKNPGKLSYATPGMGTVAFFAMEIIKLSYGLDIVPVHFQGTGPAKNAIMGGHVDLCSSGFGALAPLVRSGHILPLVTTASKRLPQFPDLPTMAEKGFPEASLNIWMSLWVPKKTLPHVVARLSAAMEKAMKDPTVAPQIEKADLFVDYRDSQATLKQAEQESATIAAFIKKSGLGK